MSLIDKLREFMNSEEGELWLEEQSRKAKLKNERILKLHERLSSLSDEEFSQFIGKLISKHDDAYEDRMYSQGIMPHPNRLLSLAFDVAIEIGVTVEPFDEFPQIFPSDTVEYRGFYFEYVYGQGTVSRIYSPEKLLIFQL